MAARTSARHSHKALCSPRRCGASLLAHITRPLAMVLAAGTSAAASTVPTVPKHGRRWASAGSRRNDREVSMADLVNLQDRLNTKQHDGVQYLRRTG